MRTTLTELIARGLAASQAKQLVWFDGKWLNSMELDHRSSHLARWLHKKGVVADTLVGICAERSLDLMTGLVGILKAGGAYVPLDPDYPSERLRFMMEDANMSILLTQQRLLDGLPATNAEIVCLDGDLHGISDEFDSSLEMDISPDSLAYVIYTSGSTGQPKGAMNTHRAICNRLEWMQSTFKLTTADAVLQKTPISFDVSVWELFWPLMVGARLVIPKPGGHLDPAYLAQIIKQQQITVLHFVPSMLQVFLDQPNLREMCKSVRLVICSGEVLSHDLQQRFFATLDAELHNLYGPTEAAVDVTHWPCKRDGKEHVVPIGWPIANTQIHILDEKLQPVPVGVEGELHIGGVQVGRGYHNRQDLTEERFINDPFSTTSGARLYKSGDLARWRSDGAVEYCGRIDHQVKVRGLRIELGEIEATLESLDDVNQAAVLAVQKQAGDQRLVAYYTTASSNAVGEERLRTTLAATLPDYMVPQHFIHMQSMPITPNGKLDRAKLPDPEIARDVTRQVISDPVEKFVASIWAEILGIQYVNRDERFFDIGGTSLSAARIVNRLQSELGEFIYVISMFDAPTVEEYARFLKRDYPTVLASKLGVNVSDSGSGRKAVETASLRISDADVTSFERAIPKIEYRPLSSANAEKNPPAIFVLAPPRSGTTLLRVMLAGHPDLFSAPELQLLCFNTLDERRRAFDGKFSLWLEGTIRSIMDIHQCDSAKAMKIMEDLEAENLTTQQCYQLFQRWVAPKTLVEKSPSYALDPGALRKAELEFDSAFYIHLSRHPFGMIESFERYHIEQVLFLKEHQYRGRQLGELIWNISHRNILDFLDDIPVDRQFSVRFEDLVTAPEAIMQDLCERARLPYSAEIVRPYSNLESKMVDGVHSESIPMGDTRMLEHKEIKGSVAEAWKERITSDYLSDSTWMLAERLGYSRSALSLDREKRQKQRKSAQSQRARRQSIRKGLKQNG